MARFVVGKIDNMHDPIALGNLDEGGRVAALVEAVNVDIDDVNFGSRRDGRTRRLAVTAPHSGWVHPDDKTLGYFVAAGVLYRLIPGFTSRPVATLSNNDRCWFEVVNGVPMVSNGTDIGWLIGDEFRPFVGSTDTDCAAPKTMYAGNFPAFWNGTLWIAKDNVLGFSLTHDVETRDDAFCRIPLDSRMRMLGAVDDGLWVSTDRRIAFITGSGPDDLQFRDVSTAVPPFGCFSAGFEFHDGRYSRVVRWASEDGFCIGLPGGIVKNISPTVALPAGETGNFSTKSHNGIEQYLAVIRKPQAGNIFTADSLTIDQHNI